MSTAFKLFCDEVAKEVASRTLCKVTILPTEIVTEDPNVTITAERIPPGEWIRVDYTGGSGGAWSGYLIDRYTPNEER